MSTTMSGRSGAAEPAISTGTFSNGIAYEAIGSGPRTVIFLPGGPGIARMAWTKVLHTLLEPLAAQGCTVWRLARRRGMPPGHSVPDMADDVAQVIDERFGGHVDAVVGLSLGGMIAQFLAARHPDAVGRVVLVSAAATPTAATVTSTRHYGEALGHGRFTAAGAAMLEDVLPGRWLRPVRYLFGLPLGRMLASSGNSLPDVLIETAAVMDVDARPVLPRITVPVLVIVGEKDPDFAPETVDETVRLIPSCRLIRYEGRGHGGTAWDERTSRHIAAFLDEPD
jgi:pimeloyl-ACP methyl ester carboxylesterase